MTILLFSGPPGSGKTTLALRLSKKSTIPYIKFPSSIHPTWPLNDLRIDVISRTVCLCAIEISKHFDFIWDRGIPDNLVYNELFKRPSDPEFYWRLLRENRDNIALVYVTATPGVLISRMSERFGESFFYE